MKKWIFPSLFTAALLLTGCQAGNDESAYDLRRDTSNPNLMSNKVDNNNRPNGNMGTMSDQNPNFLNLRGTSLNDASNRNNTGRDIDIARDIVNDTGDFRAQSIWISNDMDNMTIEVDHVGTLTADERNNAKARLHKKLSQALPRYTIEIRDR